MDRIWTKWQGRNKARLWDYAGNTIQNSTANVAELDDVLDLMGLAPSRSVSSVMDTLKNGLCYTVSAFRNLFPAWDVLTNSGYSMTSYDLVEPMNFERLSERLLLAFAPWTSVFGHDSRFFFLFWFVMDYAWTAVNYMDLELMMYTAIVWH